MSFSFIDEIYITISYPITSGFHCPHSILTLGCPTLFLPHRLGFGLLHLCSLAVLGTAECDLRASRRIQFHRKVKQNRLSPIHTDIHIHTFNFEKISVCRFDHIFYQIPQYTDHLQSIVRWYWWWWDIHNFNHNL